MKPIRVILAKKGNFVEKFAHMILKVSCFLTVLQKK